MSLFRRAMIALLAVLTVLPFVGAEAAAAPKTNTAPTAQVFRNANDVIVKVSNGRVAVEDGALVFKNAKGNVVEAFELAFLAPNADVYDVAATVKGDTTVTLTPSLVARHDAAKRKDGQIVCGPQTRNQRNIEARNKLNAEMATNVTVGALVGTILGAIIGIIPGGPITAPIAALIGAGIGAGIGLAASIPAFDTYNKTIRKPFTPKYC